MKCIYLNMYKNNVGMIGLGSWGKNIYRNLEALNVLKKIYDTNTEILNNTVTFKKKIAKKGPITGHVSRDSAIAQPREVKTGEN